MPSDPSPEERLLNLIRRTSKENKESEKEGASQKAVSGKIRFDVVSQKRHQMGRKKTHRMNQLLALILVMCLIWTVYEICFNTDEVDRWSAQFETEEGLIHEKVPKVYGDVALPKIMDAFRGRELFQMIQVEEMTETSVETVPLRDLVAHLSLSGVVGGDPPQAIIYDNKLRQTFFLYEGDTLEGILIKAISPGRVTLEYQNEELDLRY
jgi:hypothetical protein